MSTPERHVFRIIDETHTGKPSFWRQLVIILLFPGVFFGPGILVDSNAMQWAGFVVFMILIALCAAAWFQDFLTPAEARRAIDKIEKGAA